MASQVGGGMRLCPSSNYIVMGSDSNDVLVFTSTSNQNIVFGTSNNSNLLVRINSNGNVGIGRSNPGFRLDVAGDLNFSGTLRQGGVPYVGSQWSNNSSNIFVLGSNVGIGVSNAGAALHVASNVRIDGNLALQSYVQMGGLDLFLGSTFSNTGQVILSSSNIQGYSNLVWGASGSNGTQFSIMSNTSNDSFRWVSGAASNSLMTLTGNGQLALGSVAANTVGNVCAGNLGLFRNRVINGDMRIDQRYNGGVLVGQTGGYFIDRWTMQENLAQVGRMSVNRSAVPATHPLGLQFAMKLFITTLMASPATNDYCQIWQTIEGYNVADFNYGTSSASPIVLSFWVYSSKTGTFSVGLTSGVQSTNRLYATSYTVSSANTWQLITITVPGDTATALANTTNGGGFTIKFVMGAGSGLQTSTINQWQASSALSASGMTNFYDSTANIMYITGVQLEKGVLATPFENRPYATELQLCQRYYEKSYPIASNPGSTGLANRNLMIPLINNGNLYWQINFMVNKRTPIVIGNITFYNESGNAGSMTLTSPTGTSITISSIGLEGTAESHASFSTPSVASGYAAGTILGNWAVAVEL